MSEQINAFTPEETGIPASELRSFIERIERLNSEKTAIGEDIKDVMHEAKSRGYCVRTIKKLISLRKKTDAERDEDDATLELYRSALGL